MPLICGHLKVGPPSILGMSVAAIWLPHCLRWSFSHYRNYWNMSFACSFSSEIMNKHASRVKKQ